MTESAPNQSARIMGIEHGLTATEMNFLFKEQGFLDGEPQKWAVTEKGRPYANEQLRAGQGTGGSLQYNPSWVVTTWDPSIKSALEITDERRLQAKEAARAARQQSRAARAAELDNVRIDDGETNDSDHALAGAAVGLVLVVVCAYGIKKAAPHVKALWRDKRAARRLKKSTSRTRGDGDTHAATSDDENPSI